MGSMFTLSFFSIHTSHKNMKKGGHYIMNITASRKTTLSVAFLILACACIGFLTYQFVEWPAEDGTHGEIILEPAYIAVGPSGNIYVADIWQSYIQKYDAAGNFITKWRDPSADEDPDSFRPTGIAVDQSENIYVTDYLNNRLQTFDSTGTLISTWGIAGTGEGEFDYPTGLAVDAQGTIFVADTGNNRIQHFDASGNIINTWGSEGSGEGEFSGPFDVALDSQGHLFVADTYNHRIQKFDTSGTFLKEWGSQGSAEGELSGPGGIWVDKQGSIFVADTQNNRMQKFDNEGGFITAWATLGEGEGELFGPCAVTVDSSGNVYIADAKNYRVQKFRPALGGKKDEDPDLEDQCIVWLGTWDVKYSDNSTVVWVIDESMVRTDSKMFPCVASGIANRAGGDDIPFKIYSMLGKKFMYTEEVGDLDPNMPYTYLNVIGDEFTAEPGGTYDIVSGTKQ
jgi:sugar lactone lactonase YvrE